MWLYRTCFRVDGEIWLSLQNTVDYSGTVAIGGVVSIARRDLQYGRTCKQKEHFRSTVRINKQAERDEEIVFLIIIYFSIS